jgi:hypothetical protein
MGVKEIAKGEAKKAVKAHEKSMHGAKGYAKGGVTSLQRKQMGRGMAKVANQKKSSFTYKGQKTNV